MVSTIGKAQIVIDETDLYDQGEEYIYSEGQLNGGVNSRLGQTGPNQVWDFSDLIPVNQDLDQIRSSLQTIYAFYFFGFDIFATKGNDVNLGLFQITNINTFQKKNSSQLWAIGLGLTFQGIPAPAYHTDVDEIYQFPLAYGDVDQSTFKYGTSFPGLADYSRTGTRENNVDGWGTIITPFDTFECIRVVTNLTQIDTLIVDSIPIPLPGATREYKWLAKNGKMPILQVSGNVLFGNFLPTQIKYRDSARVTRVDFEANYTEPLTNQMVSLSNLSISPANTSPSYTWNITPSTVHYTNGTWIHDKDLYVIFNDTVTYTVQLILDNSLGTYDTVKVDYIHPSYPVSVKPVDDANLNIAVYPNPVTDQLLIQSEKHNIATIKLYNQAGQQVYNTEALLDKNITLDMDQLKLSKGNYFLEVTTVNGLTNTFQFIYQK